MAPLSFGLSLRLGLALCFAGHGVLAAQAHAPWIVLFGAVGLGEGFARAALPVIGALDLLVALLLVLMPTRTLFAWAATWTLLTASVRVLAGFGLDELLVRAVNWGPALALLVATRGSWGARIAGPPPTRAALAVLVCALASSALGVVLGATLLPTEPSLVTWMERGGLPAAIVAVALALVGPRQRATQVSSTSSSSST